MITLAIGKLFYKLLIQKDLFIYKHIHSVLLELCCFTRTRKPLLLFKLMTLLRVMEVLNSKGKLLESHKVTLSTTTKADQEVNYIASPQMAILYNIKSSIPYLFSTLQMNFFFGVAQCYIKTIQNTTLCKPHEVSSRAFSALSFPSAPRLSLPSPSPSLSRSNLPMRLNLASLP